MTINRVTIAGFTGKDAHTSSTQSGKSRTKLSVATTKRYKDAEGSWREKTQWHTCVAYTGTAEYCSRIQTGDQVFIEGELVYREYDRTIETDNGPVKVQWPVTEIVIESVSVLNRKERDQQKGAA
jgi:single-strand DNA-binding protein